MKKTINRKTIFISGGTGSFGTAMTNILLKNYKPKKIIIFSRDELKQYEMKNSIPTKYLKIMRFFIGDIRDLSRLKIAIATLGMCVCCAINGNV